MEGESARSWFVLLTGGTNDVVMLKHYFTTSGLQFDEIDGKFAVSAPAMEKCGPGDRDCAMDAAAELIERVNIALSISEPSFSRFDIDGLIEHRDGKIHRVMKAGTGAYVLLGGAAAVGIAGNIGKPVRSKEERLASLLVKDDRIKEIAQAFSIKPHTWPAMRTIYESAVGITCGDRKKWKEFVQKGWLAEPESNSFYETASFHSHGFPKTQPKTPMDYVEARSLIQRIFWMLVDELEPT